MPQSDRRYVTRAGLETKKGIAEPPRVLTCLPAHRARPPGTPPRLLERREQLVGLPSWRGKGEEAKRDYGEVATDGREGKGSDGREGMGWANSGPEDLQVEWAGS